MSENEMDLQVPEESIDTPDTNVDTGADVAATPHTGVTADGLTKFFEEYEQTQGEGEEHTDPIEPSNQEAPPTQPVPPVQPLQPTVAIPSDLLTTLGKLAMRALPEEKAPEQSLPEPELPPMPEMPAILQGTPEEQAQNYYEDPIAFNNALYEYKLAEYSAKQQRDRIMQEYNQQVELNQKTKAWQEAFTGQVVALGSDTFNKRADIVQKILTENPALQKLPPKDAVNFAFKLAEERATTFGTDVKSLNPDVKKALKQALSQEIIQEYLKGVSSGQRPPAVISGAIPSGSPPTTPPNKPRTLDEATRQWLARMPT